MDYYKPLNENGKEEARCSFCRERFEVPDNYRRDRFGMKMRYCLSFYSRESNFAGGQKHEEVVLCGVMCPSCMQKMRDFWCEHGVDPEDFDRCFGNKGN